MASFCWTSHPYAGVPITISPDDLQALQSHIAARSQTVPQARLVSALKADRLEFSGAHVALEDLTQIAPRDRNQLIEFLQSKGFQIYWICGASLAQTAPQKPATPQTSTAKCLERSKLHPSLRDLPTAYLSIYSEFNSSNKPELVVDDRSRKIHILHALLQHHLERTSPALIGEYSQWALIAALGSTLRKLSAPTAQDKATLDQIDRLELLESRLDIYEILIRYHSSFGIPKDEALAALQVLIKDVASMNRDRKVELESLRASLQK